MFFRPPPPPGELFSDKCFRAPLLFPIKHARLPCRLSSPGAPQAAFRASLVARRRPHSGLPVLQHHRRVTLQHRLGPGDAHTRVTLQHHRRVTLQYHRWVTLQHRLGPGDAHTRVTLQHHRRVTLLHHRWVAPLHQIGYPAAPTWARRCTHVGYPAAPQVGYPAASHRWVTLLHQIGYPAASHRWVTLLHHGSQQLVTLQRR
jgi:hypothetical protein